MQVQRAFIASRGRLSVTARAVKTAPAPAKAAPKASTSGSGLAALAKLEKLGLLSQVEKLGLLSKLEASGLTLSTIEEQGLLSQLESSGLLTAIADKNTPGLINTLGLLALALAAGVVFAVPDDSTGLLAAQAAGAAVFGGAGLAAFWGASLLSTLQKLD